jgi:trimeric autotransporter adhesin
VAPAATYAFIGGGQTNVVAGEYGVLIGGLKNSAGASFSVVAGGQNNSASSDHSFIGSGSNNLITTARGSLPNGGSYAVIVGGSGNVIAATSRNGGEYASIGGGLNNTANGIGATVPGGSYNAASGTDSFAAGTGSFAATRGSFVWSDDAAGATPLTSTVSNQFLARASGGFILYTDPTLTTGVVLSPGSGTWASLSDQASKTAIRPVDDTEILNRLTRLPITTWSYVSEPRSVRHMGPMAQDFYSAFGLGEDNLHITSIDEDGVALAAIKGLNERITRRSREIDALQQEVTQLASEVQAMQHNSRLMHARQRTHS